MAQTIGDAREEWGWDVVRMAEDFCNKMKAETRPFYIVYAAKRDQNRESSFIQTMKAYYGRPPKILGILTWFVDNAKGIFEFLPELSCPPDVPVDPVLLSDKPKDASPRIMEQGEKLNVLLS